MIGVNIMHKIFITLLFGIFLSQSAMAKTFPTVKEVIESSFPKDTIMTKHNLVLTKKQFNEIQQKAKAKVDTKIYRYYELTNAEETVGFALLMFRKVRTKKTTVIYGFDMNDTLKFTEILAFGEAPEWLPSSTWMSQLQNKTPKDALRIGEDLPTISGATLSARCLSEATRIARAIYEIGLK
ncbi:MAG: Unknown protein [uncultured Sulfurovum sp.]|uniref:FMN-binding domain-containing protein n=1 Tax=uncultured Sulfurovum sp. TaxID=269237 RepID=A0A6S6UI15_9BACT|nr:MAG: Unknown protein [uncultured Sulfurovum sp.]